MGCTASSWGLEDVNDAELGDVVGKLLNVMEEVMVVVVFPDLLQQLTAAEGAHGPEFRVVLMQLERFCSVPLHCSVYGHSSWF